MDFFVTKRTKVEVTDASPIEPSVEPPAQETAQGVEDALGDFEANESLNKIETESALLDVGAFHLHPWVTKATCQGAISHRTATLGGSDKEREALGPDASQQGEGGAGTKSKCQVEQGGGNKTGKTYTGETPSA
jgi:hypothetical protein